MPRLDGIWPDEHTEFLRECLVGGMSAAKTADALNRRFRTKYTRNAVIGRAGRAKISLSTTREKPKRPHKPKPKTIKIRPKLKPFKLDAAEYRCADVEPRHVSIFELNDGDCRWPYGDGPFTFCGHQTLDGDSYCVEHAALALPIPDPRKKAA